MTKEEIEKSISLAHLEIQNLQGAIRNLSVEVNSVANLLATLNEKVSNIVGDVAKLKMADKDLERKYDTKVTRYE